MTLVVVALAVIALLFLIWEIWICEGTHLGKRFVVWMYDLAAMRYDRIKDFDEEWERLFLGEPLARTVLGLPDVRLLDVGAGTGRTARALLPILRKAEGDLPSQATGRRGGSLGTFVNLEPSARMLALGRRRTGENVHWIRGWAVPLPFEARTFDLVVSLEILEFTPNPRETICELRRVLKPGGWLMVTNRRSWEAPLILGKTFPTKAFPKILSELGFREIEVFPWQVDYDLAWARKPWTAEVEGVKDAHRPVPPGR